MGKCLCDKYGSLSWDVQYNKNLGVVLLEMQIGEFLDLLDNQLGWYIFDIVRNFVLKKQIEGKY